MMYDIEQQPKKFFLVMRPENDQDQQMLRQLMGYRIQLDQNITLPNPPPESKRYEYLEIDLGFPLNVTSAPEL